MSISREVLNIIEKNKICWENFIKQCDELGFGIFSQVKIQNGVPVYIRNIERGVDLTKKRVENNVIRLSGKKD